MALSTMKITIVPKTTPGKWSLGLIGGLVVFLALLVILTPIGERSGGTFPGNLALAVPGLLAAVSGIAAFFTGSFGIIFRRERAILAFLAAFIGLDVLLFCLGEIFSPH